MVPLASTKTVITTQIDETIIKAEKFGVISNTINDMVPNLNKLLREASKYLNITVELNKINNNFF